MSRFLLRLAITAGICIFHLGALPAAEEETSARPLPSAGQRRILAALDERTEFDFRERPFREVIDYFKQQHEIDILFETRALSGAGMDIDAPITLTLKDVSLRSALRLLLMPLELTYSVGDGYLLITSNTEAENRLTCKIYPVHELVTLDSDFRPRPTKRDERDDSPVLNEVISPAGGGMGMGMGGMGMGGMGMGGMGMGGMGMGGSGKTGRVDDFQALINMLTGSVAPTTWDEVGGPGSITANENSQALAVSQTDDVHEEIAALLAALRRVRDEQLAAAKIDEPPPPPVPPENDEQLKLRGYRLMRRTMSKSGWRPPMQLAGDNQPPRPRQASDNNKQSSDSSGDAAKGTSPAKQAAPDKDAGAGDKAPPPHPRDETLEAWAEKIASLVPEMIEPQSWQPSGEGTIRAVGEAVVVRHTEDVQRRVARLMAELVPDAVPLSFTGPWGPWRVALQVDHAEVRMRLATTANWPEQAEPRLCGEQARIHRALDEKCDLEFKQVPLIDALKQLAEQRQVQLYIDRRALADAGIKADRPITQSVNTALGGDGLGNRL